MSKKLFVWLIGVLFWGGCMFLLLDFDLIRGLHKASRGSAAYDLMIVKVVLSALLASVFGYLFGVRVWNQLERRRQ